MQNVRMRFPGGKAKAFTTSYDDGVQQDARLIEIMRKNGIHGTFNLNSGCFAAEGTVYPTAQVHRRMTLNECLKTYTGSDIEVAAHGSTHPFLEAIPTGSAVMQVIEDRRSLEKAFGCIVRGMAYPYGTYSSDVVDILRLSQIAYARTTEARLNFDIPTDWLRLGATCHHNHPALNDLGDKFVNDKPNREPWLFYLWGHAYEFEGDDNWSLIEAFLGKVGRREDIWYATNIEIYDYVKAFQALIFSVDGRMIYNPSAIEVWAEIDARIVRVPSGQAVLR